MAKLIAETGDLAGAEYPLGTKPLVLGRLKSNDIEVRDTKASRKHTRVGRLGDDWVVEDLKSSNGTFVNGAQIEARVVLQEGDTIAIGKTVYRFDPGTSAAAPAASKPASKPATKRTPPPVSVPDAVDELDAMDAIDGTMEPQELSLEEPEELGLDELHVDAGGPAAAPTAPAAPKGPAPRPAVRGQALVSVNSVQRASRTGILGEDIGQRGAIFQGIIYLAGIILFGAMVYGAYALAVGAMGDGLEPVSVDGAAGAGGDADEADDPEKDSGE